MFVWAVILTPIVLAATLLGAAARAIGRRYGVTIPWALIATLILAGLGAHIIALGRN